MAKIQRVTQKIFGDDAITQQFTQFGTAKTDNPVYTKDLESLQGGEFDGGWADAVQEDYAPYMEDMNGYMYMVTTQLAYILQQGAAIEYDAETVYYPGSIVVADDGSGTWYKAIAGDDDNKNQGRGLANTAYWQQIQLAKNGTPLFTQITTDYVLSGDDAIGWAMQGSTVQRSVYPEAFDRILSLYNAGSSVTYRGIPAKRTTDGRYIADISQQTAINTLFNNTGVADFYMIDTSALSFRLPRNGRFIQYTTSTNSVNQFNDNGLPPLQQTINATTVSNGGHKHSPGDLNATGTMIGECKSGTGVFSTKSYSSDSPNGSDNATQKISFELKGNWTSGRTAEAGRHTHTVNVTNTIGNQIYGRSSIVQPAASLKLLYYRVGDTAV